MFGTARGVTGEKRIHSGKDRQAVAGGSYRRALRRILMFRLATCGLGVCGSRLRHDLHSVFF